MPIDDSYAADKSLAFELFLDGRRVPAGGGLFDHRDPGDKFGLLVRGPSIARKLESRD